MAYLLIVIKTVTSLLEGIFIKKYNSKPRGDSGFIFMSLISFCSMLFFVFTNKNGFCLDTPLIWYGLAGGLLYCGASFLTFLALQCGSFAMTMLILSYGIVFSIGYGLFFLNETLSLVAYIGLAFLLISLFLVRSEKETGEKRKVTLRWLVFIILSVVGSGMYAVIQRMQQIAFNDVRTNEFMIISLGLSGMIMLLIGLIKDRKMLKQVFHPDLLLAVGAGASNGVTNLLGLIVYMLIPIAISAPLASGVKIVLSFAISSVIFKEKFLKRQIAGVILGAAALVLLNL